jgi:hypothetical protein
LPQLPRGSPSGGNSAGHSSYGSPRPPPTSTVNMIPTPGPSVTSNPPPPVPTSDASPASIGSSKPVSEITAKWGTPAHLPPKPPPPETMEPKMYNEINRGLPSYPGVPRIPSGGFNPVTK